MQRLTVAAGHTQTHHNRQDSSGRVITPTQGTLSDNIRQSQQTGFYAPGEIRTLIFRKRGAADPRLTRRSPSLNP